MIACNIRLAGVEYMFCDARQRAPSSGRRLTARELRGLLAAHGSNPRVRALLSELDRARPERLRHDLGRRRERPSARAVNALRCYELDTAIPKISPTAIPELAPPVASTFEPSPMFDEQPHWVELCLVGENEEPIPGVRCEVTLPSGKVVRRRSDRHGLVRIEGITTPGACSLTLPDLDQNAWEPA
ncbi:hypothetical protein ENSA5_55680 [Enhygromyxa salina]|uniref:Uncharacterized protein n=1 Tax=Enhygromyxa salina TaxID=215803 RepID=A0A2S9XFJ7_9BACT|nr:hypothetical protein [Enhygromyxa salina]PRP91451.1 hypothetical protein ENSA5_55680 [Enhygromyxa salina]